MASLRWWGGTAGAAVAALALTLAGCASSTPPAATGPPSTAGQDASAPGPRGTAPSAPSDPPVFAVVQGARLQVRSVTTGRLVHILARNVGDISFDPQRASIYYESDAGRLDPFSIDRISVRGGAAHRVASGEDPTVSPDGTELAYATGNGQAIAILDLTTGRTRIIPLRSLIGPSASFNNTPGTVAWLGDHRLVAVPPADGNDLMPSPTTTAAPPAGTCSAEYAASEQCALVIDLRGPRPAHLVTLYRRKDASLESAGAGPAPGTLLVSVDFSTVIRLKVTDTTARIERTIRAPAGEPLLVAFSPDGRHALLLRHHGPVQLWTADVTATAVRPAQELLANADLGSASW